MLAVALAATLGAGCGEGGEPDLENGKRLYTGEGRCASCHVLQRAGSGGTVGPNLDEAFARARRDGLGENTIAAVVRDQIANVRKGSLMPEDLVTGDDARDVAAYVAQAAGAPGPDPGGLATAGEPLAGPEDQGREVFNAAGCASCHALSDVGSSGNAGPRLDNLALAAALRRPGMPPEQYVREAIVNPDAFLVGGFPRGVMPAYGRRLTPEQVNVLVAYMLRPRAVTPGG